MVDSTARGGKARGGGGKARAKAPSKSTAAKSAQPESASSKTSSKAGSSARSKAAATAKASKQSAAKKKAPAAAKRSAASKKQNTTPAAKAKTSSGRKTSKRAVGAKPVASGSDATATKGTPEPVTPNISAEKRAQQEANRKLWEAYGASRSEELREEIILQYAPLVKYVMGRLAISLPAVLDYEDILSFGTIGLIEAVERFDYQKGVKFETYAIARIRGAIIDALRSLDRLPRSVRQKAKDAGRALVDLAEGLGRDPTDEEVAEAMGLTIQAYRKHLIDASWVTVSLDTMGTSNDGEEDAGGAALGIADPDDEDFSVGLEQQELVGELAGRSGNYPSANSSSFLFTTRRS